MGHTRIAPDGFHGSDGVTRTSRQIVDLLRSSPDADSFVIQQRLRSHHVVSALSGNSNLQTLRITTFIDHDLNCRLLFSHLKLMTRADVFTDNIGDGLTGGITNVICLETGTIAKSFMKTNDGTGDRWVSHHPATRRALTGFAVPCWKEACELVRRAAPAFLPVRSVGWDVGITDEGVRIVEGNIWWDRRHYAGDYLTVLLSDLEGARTGRAEEP